MNYLFKYNNYNSAVQQRAIALILVSKGKILCGGKLSIEGLQSAGRVQMNERGWDVELAIKQENCLEVSAEGQVSQIDVMPIAELCIEEKGINKEICTKENF